MAIDIVVLLVLILAVFKGLKRGLVVALFSVIALVLGLAAAIKLSAVAAGYLRETVHISARWIPVLAFVLVLIGVMLLVRLLAGLLEKALDLALMGWVNKLGGILLYAAVYLTILSVLFFYGAKSHVITESAMGASRTYALIEPWGPRVINGLGKLIPLFRDMFSQLEDFFDHVSRQLPK